MAIYQNRILVVDDDDMMLSYLKELLTPRYDVVTAAGGEEAIAFLSKTQRVDLMILDIRMPGIDGYELMEHIRTIPVCMDVPAIFLTGVAGHEAEIKGLNTGVTDYIVKPFQPDVLHARIAALLRSAKRLDMTKIPPTSVELTDAELAILQMVALSYTNEDIAERTGYTNGYVRQIISKLLQKVGIVNRRDARDFL